MRGFPYILLLAVLCVSIDAFAAQSFMPRLIGYAGDVTVKGGYDYSEDKRDSFKSYTRTSLLRESLNLQTVGYVYHPNLLFFKLEGTGYYEQERNSGVTTVNYNSSEATYGIEGKVFRKKPLNMEFYAKQERPFLVNSDRNDRVEELDRSGIAFNYRKKGFLSSLKYDRQYEKRSDSETRTDDYDTYASYFTNEWSVLKDVNLSLWGLHQDRSEKTDNTFDNLNLNGNFKYKIFEISNNFNYRKNDSATESSDMYGLNHRVLAKLPWNFTSVAQYRLNRNDTERFSTQTGITESSSDVDYYDFELTQKLFSSLVTKMRADLSKNKSTSGSSEVKKYSVDTRYTKKLPANSRLEAGLGSKTTWAERDGQLPVKDKIERAIEGGAVFLDIDADTDSLVAIQVCMDKDGVGCQPANASQWLALTELDHYSIISGSSPPEIRISNTLQHDLAGLGLVQPVDSFYIFKINYYLNKADFTIKSERGDFFVNLDLFGIVSGDYYHSVLRQEFDEGDKEFQELENIHPKSTDDMLSLSMSNGPLWARVSYQTIKSATSQETYDLTMSYKKDDIPTGVKFIKAGLALDYTFKDVTTDNEDGSSSEDTNIRASYDLGVLATVPRVLVVVTFDSTYEYLRGDTQIITFTDGDIPRLSPTTGLDDRDVFYNALTVNRQFKEPRTKITTSIWGKGTWEKTTGSEDTYLEKYEYGLRANRAWVFGKTTFSINARYQVTETIENNYEADIENNRTKTDAKVMMKMVRQIF